MRDIVSESQKDDMVDPFIRLCRNYSKADHRFPDYLLNAKAKCFKELYSILLSQVEKHTLPIGYSFFDTYKAWCGIIFRAKCLNISCAFMMHPFDYLQYTERMSKEDIAECFKTYSNWKACVKQCKEIRKNSMVRA